MKKPRASSFGRFALCLGLALILELGLVPARTMAADTTPIVGNWEGTLDPGAQPKKKIVVHISASQDGSLSGTIAYPYQATSAILITPTPSNNPTLPF